MLVSAAVARTKECCNDRNKLCVANGCMGWVEEEVPEKASGRLAEYGVVATAMIKTGLGYCGAIGGSK